jgi:hypothetical protein
VILGQILNRRTLCEKAQLCHLAWHCFALELKSLDSLDGCTSASYASIKQFGVYVDQPFSRPTTPRSVCLRYITAHT